MKKFFYLYLSILFLTLSLSAFTQTKVDPWTVGLYGNLTTYQGDLGNYALKLDKAKLGFTVTGTYYISPFFDLRGRISYGKVEIYDEDGTYAAGYGGYADLINSTSGVNRSWGFKGNMWANTINLIFKFNNNYIFREDILIKPYLNVGIGETRFITKSFRDITSLKKYHNRNLYIALGIKYPINEYFTIELEGGQHYNKNDDLDGITVSTAPGWINKGDKIVNSKGSSGPVGSVGASNDAFFQFSLGVTYNLKFGDNNDNDNDGIVNKIDDCPNTPKEAKVDEKGCSIDRDGDGLADYVDECPEVKGTIKGCIDTDGDNIADKDDACPAIKGHESYSGCPDSDGDGIADNEDSCPNKKGPKINNGCPYPDGDGDGIADFYDDCPNRRGLSSNKGCPKTQLLENKTIKTIVYFDFNKTVIKPKYYDVINKLIDIIKAEDNRILYIEGHTDYIGSKLYNLQLAKKRALAVKKYVFKKGVNKDKIFLKGFGEGKPVETNKTQLGRKQNRRSELYLIVKYQ